MTARAWLRALIERWETPGFFLVAVSDSGRPIVYLANYDGFYNDMTPTVYATFAEAHAVYLRRGGRERLICRRGPRICAEWIAQTQVEDIPRVVWSNRGTTASASGHGLLPPGIQDADCDQSM